MGEIRRVEKKVLMDPGAVAACLEQMTVALAEQIGGRKAALVGIQTGGVHLARRLQAGLEKIGAGRPPLGVLDITLYRDDIFLGLQQPQVRHTDIPFELSGMEVVLVDDVLYTGRTVRAALDALVDFGRPKLIRLAVLVDRGLREYPIQADLVGLKTETQPSERVQLELVEMGYAQDRVVVYERA